MWPHSHFLVSVAVFGPSPAAIIGGVGPDLFSGLNWANKYLSKKVSWTMMTKHNDKFIAKIDSGKLWELHSLTHSVWVAIGLAALAQYFFSRGDHIQFIFVASFLMHLCIDYLTHNNVMPLYPIRKKFNFKILRFDPSNPKVEVIGNIILLAVIFLRYIYKT